MSWQGIVKVQRSIETTEPAPQVLIYNKSKKIMTQRELTPILADWFNEGELKIFMHATFKRGQLHLLRRADQQPW